MESPVIEITDGNIAAVTSGFVAAGHARKVLDFRGCSVLPGLIDPHVHLALRPELEASEVMEWAQCAGDEQVTMVMRRHAEAALARGITTVRDCGSPGKAGVMFREGLGRSPSVARALVCGRPITTPGGHCHWMGLPCSTEAEVAAAVAELAGEGVDFIKVMATGGMMTPGSDPYAAQFPTPVLTRLVEEAHSRGKPVAAHALSAPGVKAALDASIDTLEHYATTTGARQDVSQELTAALAVSGITVGVTAHHSLREMLRAGKNQDIKDRLAPHRLLRQAGARTTVHSDAGTPGTRVEDFADSVEIFMIGMMLTPVEAIKAVTADAAAAIGVGGTTGMVQAGKRADLLVVAGRADREISALRDVVTVFKNGFRLPQRRAVSD